MDLRLTIYTDDTLTEVKRVAEADELKIPYRVTGYLMRSMENLSLEDKEGIFDFIVSNVDILDKIIKATFGVSESELAAINTTELINVGADICAWCMDKIKNLKQGNNSKNVGATA